MNWTAAKQLVLLCVLGVCASEAAADWPTFRGNPQRTGSVDGKPGPDKPKVLWVFKSPDHFIAAPVPAGDRLLIAGVGVLGPGAFSALALEPKDKQLLWSKGAPWLRLPSVSAPAVADNKVVFGDAMHIHSGCHLYVWGLDGGESPLYEVALTGNLFHLEGSPTVAGKKAYFGCGNGGVLCVDLEKLTLKGKDVPAAELPKELDKIWAEMLKQYEIDFKKDPVFTAKPTRDKLPRPTPVQLWQVGVDKWHVDAPVNVIGERLLATSAFLDKEMVGDRALYALDLKTGRTQWRSSLPLNPWGGASVQDKTVVVTGSSISYDPRDIKGAKGFIAAFDLESGKPLWPAKEIKAGIQSCAALSDGKAIITGTDGKVRAYTLSDGVSAWTYDAKAPIFAPPAVAGDTVYVGDLLGVVHAINLNGGAVKWTLNLATDPAVKMPGMIYGGPVVHGGKVYVATCNHVAGPGAKEPLGKESAVVCIGQ